MSPRKVPRVSSEITRARMSRESFDVHFVDDRLGGWPVERVVAFPVVQTWIHDHALHCRGGSCRLSVLRSFTRVVSRNNDSATIRVEQDLWQDQNAIPLDGIERPMNPIPIKLARLHAWNEDMPVVISAVDGWIQADHTRGPPVIFVIEEQQFDT